MNSRSSLRRRWWRRWPDQRGAIILWAAAALGVFLTVGAFVIDIGYVFMTKSQLQNAADAGASKGATLLYYRADVTGDGVPDPMTYDMVVSGSYVKPNFTLAEAHATANATENSAEKRLVATGDVLAEGGCWNTAPASGQSAWIAKSASGCLNDGKIFPAMRVTVTRSSVILFFERFIGLGTATVDAQAIALVKSPGSVGSGIMLPIAFDEQAYLGTRTAPLDPLYIAEDQAIRDGGYWATLVSNASASYIRDVIYGNLLQAGAGVGDMMAVSDSAKDVAYQAFVDCVTNTALACHARVQQAVLPITRRVDNVTATIIGFACVRIASAQAGGTNSKLVFYPNTGCMVAQSPLPGIYAGTTDGTRMVF